jgi:hypothetical protein
MALVAMALTLTESNMPLVKPTVGQTAWGGTLNTALDYLDTNAIKASSRPTIIAASPDITLALSDAGTLIRVEADEDQYRQDFRVPPNSLVAFPIGTVITFVTIDVSIQMLEATDEDTDTRSNIYGEGRGTNTNWMGFTGTGVTRLIKIGTDDWIFAGNNIWWD